MTQGAYERDLVVLTADKNMKFALQGLLNRSEALQIRPIKAVFYIHPESDPGCLLRADAFLRPFINHFPHAIVMFDREGSGRQHKMREELEEEVFAGLSRSGWEDRASVIVIDPELENWVFSESPEVDTAMGWAGRNPSLRLWLKAQGFLMPDQAKPSRPKEAMEAALRHVRIPRSSSIYGRLAEHVGLGRCTDRAFLKLITTLQSWFPVLDKEPQ
jgi:hypothetical protein